MKKTLLLAGILMALVLCLGSAQSAVLYDNFVPDDGFISWWGQAIDVGQQMAVPFTVTGNFYPDSVAVPIDGDGYINVSLLGDNNGVPGSTIESLGNMPLGATPSVVTFNSSVNSLLVSGQTYWVGVFPADANSWGSWYVNSAYTVGPMRFTNYSPTWISTAMTLPAMRVSGTPAPVPEPSSLLVLIGGVGGLGGMLFRRRRR